MANSFALTQKVANRLLLILKNQLVMGRLVDSGLASQFGKSSDEVPIGDTVSVRRPPSFIASDGATFVNQDLVVGKCDVVIDKQKHVGFTLSEFNRVLDYDGDGFLKDAVASARMVAIAQQIETDLMGCVLDFAGWVGTPGQTIDSATDFNKMPERLDNMAVPATDRSGILSVADYWALAGALGNFGALNDEINVSALTRARLPMLGSVQPYMAQSARTVTCGTRTNGTINGASQNVNYASVKDTYTQTLLVDGLGASATVKRGEVFTIADVYAINPRTREALPYLQEFVVAADATADGTGAASLTISMPIIAASGADETLRLNQAHQTVSAVPADGAVVTWKGSASTGYVQNASFHKDAIKLVYAKPAKPHTGEFTYATDPDTGVTLRLWAFSDGTADTHSYRADVIYGVKNADPRLGVRGSGTA